MTPAARQGMAMAPLWTASFVLLCLTVLMGYAHMAVLTPIIPLYVADKGGSAFLAGLALLTFSVPSFAVRPFVGHLADVWSASGVLKLGLLLLAVGGLLFLTPLLAMVFVASAVRGLGWAGLNTGGYTLLANGAPPTRRGEASGYYTSITSSASILFPALALWLIDAPGAGFQAVFLVSAAIGFGGVILCNFGMRQTPPKEQQAAPRLDGGETGGVASGLLDRGVLLATALNLSSTLASPAVWSFLPLYARDLGIGNIGIYYVVSGITSLLIRPLIGRRSDSMGRGPVLALGFTCFAIGLVLIILAQGLPMIVAGGIFTSLGSALNGSTTTALAMDLADPARRGKSMATFSVSFQLGSGFGSLIAGAIADLAGYRGMYVGSLVFVCCGFLLLAAIWRSLPGASNKPAGP